MGQRLVFAGLSLSSMNRFHFDIDIPGNRNIPHGNNKHATIYSMTCESIVKMVYFINKINQCLRDWKNMCFSSLQKYSTCVSGSYVEYD